MQEIARSIWPDMTTVLHHERLCGRIIKIKSNLRRKTLHRTNEDSNFLVGSFSNRDNRRTLIQMPRKSLMYSKKSVGALRNSNNDLILLRRFSIQNHLKLSITEKRQNKTKYLAWNSIKFEFVKKNSMPHTAESLGFIKCHSLSSPRPIKSNSNFIRYKCQ